MEYLRLGKLHEHVIQEISSYYSSLNLIVIQMDYYSEGSLDDIDVKIFFNDIGYRHVLGDICLGLHELHSFNIPHNNLKPSNVLLKGDNKYLITDYCKNILYDGDDIIIPTASTFEYLSPEVIKGEEPTIYSDMWSYGCLMYYIYTGKTPFYSPSFFELTMNIVKGEYIDLSDDIDDPVNKLLSQLLCINPEDRLSTNKVYKSIPELDGFVSRTASMCSSRALSIAQSNPDVDKVIEDVIRHAQVHPEKFLQLTGVDLGYDGKVYFCEQLESINGLRHLQIASIIKYLY